jgi:pyruvate formate lyase activating enzyme
MIHHSTTPLLGYIFEIQKLSTEDGPGIRTTVFLKECPLHCLWCHNPESISKIKSIQWFKIKCIGCHTCIDHCPQHALTLDDLGMHIDRRRCQACGTCAQVCPSTAMKAFGDLITVDDLYDEINKDRVYYEKSGGGITVSGGEPTIQVDFIEDFLKKCTENGIHTALDTCGVASLSTLNRLLPYTNLVLYDLKEIDPQKHRSFTGLSNETILKNAIWFTEKLPASGESLWIRTPLIPQYTGTDANVLGIGHFIMEQLHNKVGRWDLLAFNNLAKSKYDRMDLEWPMKEISLFTDKEMNHFLELAKSTGVRNVFWSGLTRQIS